MIKYFFFVSKNIFLQKILNTGNSESPIICCDKKVNNFFCVHKKRDKEV